MNSRRQEMKFFVLCTLLVYQHVMAAGDLAFMRTNKVKGDSADEVARKAIQRLSNPTRGRRRLEQNTDQTSSDNTDQTSSDNTDQTSSDGWYSAFKDAWMDQSSGEGSEISSSCIKRSSTMVMTYSVAQSVNDSPPTSAPLTYSTAQINLSPTSAPVEINEVSDGTVIILTDPNGQPSGNTGLISGNPEAYPTGSGSTSGSGKYGNQGKSGKGKSPGTASSSGKGGKGKKGKKDKHGKGKKGKGKKGKGKKGYEEYCDDDDDDWTDQDNDETNDQNGDGGISDGDSDDGTDGDDLSNDGNNDQNTDGGISDGDDDDGTGNDENNDQNNDGTDIGNDQHNDQSGGGGGDVASDLSPCELYQSGEAPTNRASQRFDMTYTLTYVPAAVTEEGSMALFQTYLQQDVGTILVCGNGLDTRRALSDKLSDDRSLQDSTGIVNNSFEDVEKNTQVQNACDPASAAFGCVDATSGGIIYYASDDGVGDPAALLKQTIEDNFIATEGLLGVSGLDITMLPIEIIPSLAPSPSPGQISDATASPITVDTDGDGFSGISGGESNPEEGLSASGYVGIAVAAAFLLLVLCFVGRRSGDRDQENGKVVAEQRSLNHSQYTDDDEEGTNNSDKGDYLPASMNVARYDEDEEMPSGLQVMLYDESSHGSSTSGHPKPKGKGKLFTSKNLAVTESHQTDSHMCGSATCEVCDTSVKSRGVRFIPAGTQDDAEVFPDHVTRGYMTGNTVTL